MIKNNKIKLMTVISVLISFILSGCRVEITATYDAVIVGSGVSGLVTAINLTENGKRVLIVEESGIVGGNSRLYADGISFLNIAGGDTTEKFMAEISANNNDKTNFFTQTLVERSSEIPTWFSKHQIQFHNIIQVPGQSMQRTFVTTKGTHTGKELVTRLESTLKTTSAEINYNSKVTSILPRNNGGYQLSIEQQSSVITVNAKTILFNDDSTSLFNATIPVKDVNENTQVTLTANNTMALLTSLGVDMRNNGTFNLLDTYNMSSAQQISSILRSYGGMLINQEGKRFVDEMANVEEITTAILAQTNQQAYLIFDDVITNALPFITEYYKESALLSTDSITDLAQRLGIEQEDILRNTIGQYHNMIIEGQDIEFERSFKDVKAEVFANISSNVGELYAITVQPVQTIVTSYAEISAQFEALTKGSVMPGIYVTGDSAYGVRLPIMLHGMVIAQHLVQGFEVSDNMLKYLSIQNF